MAILNQAANLNLIPGISAQVVVHLSQANVGDTLTFYLYSGSEPFSGTGVAVALNGVRKDGVGFTAPCVIGGNVLTVTVTESMTALPGYALAELVLTDGSGASVGTANFALAIEEGTFPNGPTYDTDISVYQQILQYVQAYPAMDQARIDAAVDSAFTAERDARISSDAAIREEIKGTKESLDAAIDDEAAARKSAMASMLTEIRSESMTRAAEDANLQTQIDQIVAPTGAAPSAAEIENARIGADGKVYPTLGDAIRTQHTNLQDVLENGGIYTPNLIGTETGKKYPVDLKAGDTFTVSTSDGSAFGSYSGADARLLLYDTDGNYVSYYSLFSNQSKRTMTLPSTVVDLGYIGLNVVMNVPLMANIGSTAMSYVPYVMPLKYQVALEREELGDFVEKTIWVKSGKTHSSTSDQLEVKAKQGEELFVSLDVSTDYSIIQFFLFYADGTVSSAYQFSVRKNAYGSVTAEKDLNYIGVFFDNSSGTADVLIRLVVSREINDSYASLNDILSVSKIPMTQDKIKTFTQHYADTGESDSFIFFSDPHILNQQSNMNTRLLAIFSERISEVKRYADEICPDAMICGGDWLNFGDTKAAAVYKLRLIKGVCEKYFGHYNFHNLLGNHDTNYQGIDQEGSDTNTGRLDQSVINNILYRDENTQKSYYAFDTPLTKYYCFDTGIDWDTAITDYQQEQLNWFAQALANADDRHIVVAMHIFSHATDEADFGRDERPMATEIVSIITAYNNRSSIAVGGVTYDYSAKAGKVHCILTGHTHFDKIYYANDNLPVICITDATDYAASATKFDMGMLDYANGKLYLVRVNDTASDRTINLR